MGQDPWHIENHKGVQQQRTDDAAYQQAVVGSKTRVCDRCTHNRKTIARGQTASCEG